MKPAKKKTTAKTIVDIKTKTERTLDWKRAAYSLKAKPGDERRAALKRLGVTEEQVERAMPMSHLLSYAEGGIPQVINAMKLAQQDDALISQFLAKWKSLSEHDRKRLPFEAVALSASLHPPYVFGAIVAALQAYNVAVVKIMAMTSHRKIVEARLRYGQLPGGDKDRTALDTAVGFLPSPKGPTFIGKAIFGSGKAVTDQQRSGDEDNDEDDNVDLEKLFPPLNRIQEKLASIRNRQLPPPKEPN
jgi:hypothetical protein